MAKPSLSVKLPHIKKQVDRSSDFFIEAPVLNLFRYGQTTDELDRLIDLGHHIDRHLKAPHPALTGWLTRANGFRSQQIPHNPDGEKITEQLASQLRRVWLQIAHDHSDTNWKSPPYDVDLPLPVNKEYSFIYERVGRAKRLEEKWQNQIDPVKGWQESGCIHNAGLSAISCLFHVLPYFYRRLKLGSFHVDFVSDYYETNALSRFLKPLNYDVNLHQTEMQAIQNIKSAQSDILFIETVRYDWVQSVSDFGKIADALLARKRHRPFTLILDSTLSGDRFRLNDFLSLLPANLPLLVIDLQSGLKLFQEGLELANLGLVKIYSNPALFDHLGKNAADFKRHLQSARKNFAANPTFDQACILDAPFILDKEKNADHMDRIFRNNAFLAQKLAKANQLFEKIHHPVLGEHARKHWAVSPLVVCAIKQTDDQPEKIKKLKQIIQGHCRERNLTFINGASFGFRHHRFELIEPVNHTYDDGQQRTYLKIAMGSHNGAVFKELVQFFTQLAACQDFAELSAADFQI